MISEINQVPFVQETQNELPVVDIQSTLEKAKEEPNYVTKRELYESAFTILKNQALNGPLDSMQQKQLHTLIENYAMGTCYGQESTDGLDEELGYRQSAALLEMNLLLQLHELGLSHIQPDWQLTSLADLMIQLGVQPGFTPNQNGKYFDACKDALKCDATKLVSAAEEKGVSLLIAKTLMGLSYSTQNISHLQSATDFHKSINELTKAAIRGQTQEELELLEDYSYNRAEFMVEQTNPGDLEALQKCYEPVLELTNKAFADQPLKRNSRIAQIKNMNGLLLYRNGLVTLSEPFFREAFNARKELIGKFDTDKENFDQRFLLCNLRTALATCCLAKGDIPEAEEHAKELQLFLDELKIRDNAHSYSNDYEKMIKKVATAKLLISK